MEIWRFEQRIALSGKKPPLALANGISLQFEKISKKKVGTTYLHKEDLFFSLRHNELKFILKETAMSFSNCVFMRLIFNDLMTQITTEYAGKKIS